MLKQTQKVEEIKLVHPLFGEGEARAFGGLYYVLTLPSYKKFVVTNGFFLMHAITGEKKNVLLFIWNTLAHFCFTEMTLS